MNPRTMTLPCPLTDAEVMLKASELGQILVNLDATEGDLKTRSSELRAEIKRGRQMASDLAKALATRTEARSVDVYDDPDHGAGLVWTVRRDTGARVESRPMTSDDRQLELVPAAVLQFDTRSGEAATERASAQANERARVRACAPECDCDHVPAQHEGNHEQDGWGPCSLCDCAGSRDPEEGAERPGSPTEGLAF